MCSLALDCATYNQKTPGGVHGGVQNSSSLALTMEIQWKISARPYENEKHNRLEQINKTRLGFYMNHA